MTTLLHIVLLILWPGCLIWFLLFAWWDDRRWASDLALREDAEVARLDAIPVPGGHWETWSS